LMASELLDFKDKLKRISPIPLAIECYRGFRKGNNPLSTINSLNSSGRWHLKEKFGAIYTGESREKKRLFCITASILDLNTV
ncbi:MAG TPA: hypothetical protein DCP02_06280, partial [Actinobacteria bacterium]|nr:hypothetical protein [Actinomycetota bacterium]